MIQVLTLARLSADVPESCRFVYSRSNPGTYLVRVEVSGTAIAGSPFSAIVTPGNVDDG